VPTSSLARSGKGPEPSRLASLAARPCERSRGRIQTLSVTAKRLGHCVSVAVRTVSGVRKRAPTLVALFGSLGLA